MTLTLDEVRRIRFPMARRPGDGYRAAEVDDFVDRVDATFAAMTDESERLKAQLDALKSSDDHSQHDEADSELAEENERLKAQLEEARAAQRGQGDEARTVKRYESELTQLSNENARLNSQLSDTRRELATARSATEAPATSQLVGDGKVERIEVTTSAQASPAVARMIELSTASAERVVSEAQDEANRKIAAAERKVHELTVDAQTRAERIESAARVNSEKLESDAKANADQVNTDAANRRDDLFRQLESERDVLLARVDRLREFESNYRQAFVSQLRTQADRMDQAAFEPSETPHLLEPDHRVERGASATPRLDALIGRGQRDESNN